MDDKEPKFLLIILCVFVLVAVIITGVFLIGNNISKESTSSGYTTSVPISNNDGFVTSDGYSFVSASTALNILRKCANDKGYTLTEKVSGKNYLDIGMDNHKNITIESGDNIY